MTRPVRSRATIESAFDRLDGALDEATTAYLMGGGAMAFRGVKDGTRDLDLVTPSRAAFERLRDALLTTGYEVVDDPIDEYASLGAAVILDTDDGCRFDLFDREVIRKLRVTERMRGRADSVYAGSTLDVFALSNEDVFLFKGVAGRRRDPEDMARLVQANRGLAFETVADEYRAQRPLNTGAVARELFERAPVNHPAIAFERAVTQLPMTLPDTLTDSVEAAADAVYAEYAVVQRLDDEWTDVAAVADAVRDQSDLDGTDVNDVIDRLAAKRLVTRDDDRVRLRPVEAD